MLAVKSITALGAGDRGRCHGSISCWRCLASSHVLLPLLAVVVSVLLAGCGVGQRYSANTATELTVRPKLLVEMHANTGDDLLVEGTAVQAKALRMSGPFAGSIPGAYGLPFSLSIAQTDLVHQFSTGAHDYYVADYELVDSRHSMIGSVIRPGDMAGIRVNKKTGGKQWFVDNSRFNGYETVWAGSVQDSDGVEFEEVSVLIVNNQSRLRTLRFAGHRSKQVYFELIDRQGSSSLKDSFAFDLADAGSTTIGVQGYILEVLGVDNVGLRYRWISFPASR